jgi:predicted AAA+ superfamily ATPase
MSLLNYSNAARESGVSVKTIREYYQILEDTLIGRTLLPWKKSRKRRLIETAKFFFDIGIVSALLGYKTLTPGTTEYGRAFEHFILQECWAYRQFTRLDFPIMFWRTASGAEVDIILGDADVAIEVKSSENAVKKTKGLHLFCEEHKCRKSLIVSRDPLPRRLKSDISILPWRVFCKMLWAGEIIS